MYWPASGQSSIKNETIIVSPLSRIMMIGLMVATIVLGVYPQPILRAIKWPSADVAKSAVINR